MVEEGWPALAQKGTAAQPGTSLPTSHPLLRTSRPLSTKGSPSARARLASGAVGVLPSCTAPSPVVSTNAVRRRASWVLPPLALALALPLGASAAAASPTGRLSTVSVRARP